MVHLRVFAHLSTITHNNYHHFYWNPNTNGVWVIVAIVVFQLNRNIKLCLIKNYNCNNYPHPMSIRIPTETG